MITIRPLEYYPAFRGLGWNFAGGWVGHVEISGPPRQGIHVRIQDTSWIPTREYLKRAVIQDVTRSWLDPPEWVIDALMKYVNNDQTT